MLYNQNPYIALIIIGNEILSGRTLDKNTQYVATKLGSIGVELKEVRVIPDVEAEIVNTVNHLREKYDYVVTTGGIGPTHDDITSAAVAKAFGVELYRHPEAYKVLAEHYKGEENFNSGRLKMTYVPQGAELIGNPISMAPGFKMENVFVLAGVPSIMQAMLENVIPQLRHGVPVRAKTVNVKTGESVIATEMTELQKKYKHIDIGSYPYTNDPDHADGKHGTNIVFRGQDVGAIDNAIGEFVGLLKKMKIDFVR